MLLSNIKTTTVIVPANEQKYTDVITLLEFGGYKNRVSGSYQSRPLIAIMPSVKTMIEAQAGGSLDTIAAHIPAHQFIKSNTISHQ